MRLGALFLIPAALAAQSPFPWDKTSILPWEISEAGEVEPAPAAMAARPPFRKVTLTTEGALKVIDPQGRILLRSGLPGRPLRLYRDAGIPLKETPLTFTFPAQTPLLKDGSQLAKFDGDYREWLQGLLWVIDDGERFLTVVHPATLRMVYLPLPSGEAWQLFLHPDRLEIREKEAPPESGRETACWSLPWSVLVPQLLQLAAPTPPPKQGTAYHPFPGN